MRLSSTLSLENINCVTFGKNLLDVSCLRSFFLHFKKLAHLDEYYIRSDIYKCFYYFGSIYWKIVIILLTFLQ